MKKLRLDLGDLRVGTFVPLDAAPAGDGSVLGHAGLDALRLTRNATCPMTEYCSQDNTCACTTAC